MDTAARVGRLTGPARTPAHRQTGTRAPGLWFLARIRRRRVRTPTRARVVSPSAPNGPRVLGFGVSGSLHRGSAAGGEERVSGGPSPHPAQSVTHFRRSVRGIRGWFAHPCSTVSDRRFDYSCSVPTIARFDRMGSVAWEWKLLPTHGMDCCADRGGCDGSDPDAPSPSMSERWRCGNLTGRSRICERMAAAGCPGQKAIGSS